MSTRTIPNPIPSPLGVVAGSTSQNEATASNPNEALSIVTNQINSMTDAFTAGINTNAEKSKIFSDYFIRKHDFQQKITLQEFKLELKYISKLRRAKLDLLDLLVALIKDGKLSKKEKKAILKKLKEFKALRNFMRINQGDTDFNKITNQLNSESIELVMRKIKVNIEEEISLSASDSKISLKDRKDSMKARSQFNEIKDFVDYILQEPG